METMDEVEVLETQDKDTAVVGVVEEVESTQSEAEDEVEAAESGSVDLDLVEVEEEDKAAESEGENSADVVAVQVEEDAESTDSVGEVNAEIEEAACANEDKNEEIEAEAELLRDHDDAMDVDESESAINDAPVDFNAPTSSLLQQAKDDGKYTGDRRLSTFENEDDFMEYLQTSVQGFVREHPFWSQTKWEDDEMDQFEDDVEQFALAAGMEDHQAENEVKRAVQAWKLKQGIEVTDATLKTALNAAAKIVNVVQNALIPEGLSKKRKRESKPIDVAPPTLEEVSAKRLKKAAKKARRKAKKQSLTQVGVETATSSVSAISSQKQDQQKGEIEPATKSSLATSSQKLNLKTSEAWYAGDATVISTVGAPKDASETEGAGSTPSTNKKSTASSKAATNSTATQEPGTAPKSKRRIKNKQGPVASAYFPVAFAAAPVEAKPELPVEEPADLADLGVAVDPQASSKIADIAKAARDAVEKAMKTTDNQQKLKRKKKRNQNKLSEEETGDVVPQQSGKPIQPPVTSSTAEVKIGEPLKKRQRKRNENRNSLNATPKSTTQQDVGNPATKAAVMVSTVDAGVAVEKSEETKENPRKHRGRKSKPHQEADATSQKPSPEKSESSQAPETKLEELPSGKKPEDTEMVDVLEHAPKTKRSRPARKSKADYEKEQAGTVELVQAKSVDTVTPVAEAPTAVDVIAQEVPALVAKTIAPSSAKKRNRSRKSQDGKGDVEMVDKIEPWAELTTTNSKKNKRDRKRKSADAMDIESPRQEEAKASHS